MIRRVGTLGHSRILGMGGIDGVTLATALMLAARLPAKRRPDTPEQAAKRVQRTEREQWNHDVEQRKAEKLAKKGKV